MSRGDPEHLAREAERVAPDDARGRSHRQKCLGGAAVRYVDRDLTPPAVYFGFAGRTTGEGRLYSLNAMTGASNWSSYYSVPFSANMWNAFLYSPAIGFDHKIYVGCENFTLHALESDGTFAWSRSRTRIARTVRTR